MFISTILLKLATLPKLVTLLKLETLLTLQKVPTNPSSLVLLIGQPMASVSTP